MIEWIVIIVVGIATYAMRFVFIALFGRIAVPPRLEKALTYVAPAVLAAITLPALVFREGVFEPLNPFVPAAIIGGLAGYLTKSIGAAIVVGLPALWLITWMVG
ncbi:MAG: AzlD domain-containing protein [Acidimicrobiia bacterium]|nr:AzlD domain-containing protein [Acidimicrobiia bacterium]